MKRFRLLLLVLLAATASLASTRDWKKRVVNDSETDVTGEMRAEKITMHYTIQRYRHSRLFLQTGPEE